MKSGALAPGSSIAASIPEEAHGKLDCGVETKKRAFRALINTIIHPYALFVKMLQRKQLLSGAHPRFSATHPPQPARRLPGLLTYIRWSAISSSSTALLASSG